MDSRCVWLRATIAVAVAIPGGESMSMEWLGSGKGGINSSIKCKTRPIWRIRAIATMTTHPANYILARFLLVRPRLLLIYILLLSYQYCMKKWTLKIDKLVKIEVQETQTSVLTSRAHFPKTSSFQISFSVRSSPTWFLHSAGDPSPRAPCGKTT